MTKVHYRPIPGYPDYRVGDDGTVQTKRPRSGGLGGTPKNAMRGWREMPVHAIGPGGHSTVKLRDPDQDTRLRDATYVQKCVHTLVLELFVGPRPAGMVAHHADGHAENCRLSNLRWERQFPKGLDDDAVAQMRERNASGESYESLASAFGVSAGEVTRVVRRLTRVAG